LLELGRKWLAGAEPDESLTLWFAGAEPDESLTLWFAGAEPDESLTLWLVGAKTTEFSNPPWLRSAGGEKGATATFFRPRRPG